MPVINLTSSFGPHRTSIERLPIRSPKTAYTGMIYYFDYESMSTSYLDLPGHIAEKRTTPVTEQDFTSYLYAPDIPDPDLLIRTGGEKRLSNFLLWELSYAELYVTDTYWPDFSEETLQKALESFGGRKRRFGGLNSQNQ